MSIGDSCPIGVRRSLTGVTLLSSNECSASTTLIGPAYVCGRDMGMFCDGMENGGCSETALTLYRIGNSNCNHVCPFLAVY